MTKALAKRSLTKKQLGQLATYTDPGIILNALKKEGWTIQKAIQKLVEIADSKDTKVSTQLAAVKYLNQMVIDAMERSGMIVMATKSTKSDTGEEATFTGHIVSSVLQGQNKSHTTMEELTGEAPEIEEPENGKEEENEEEVSQEDTQGKTSVREGADGDSRNRSPAGTGERTESDGSHGSDSSPDSGSTKSKGSGTATGLSDDLHSSKYPEVHLEAFKGLAVPSESGGAGPASDTINEFI